MADKQTQRQQQSPQEQQQTPEQQQQQQQAPQEQDDRSDALKQAHSDSLSPDQKHQNYLKDLERLHNEP